MRNKTSITIMLVSGVVLNIVLWVIPALFFPKSNPSTVLHYNADLGIDFIGQGIKIFVLPSIGTFLLILNFTLGFFLYRIESRVSWLLWSTVPLAQTLLLISLSLLLHINAIES
jgi:hypothetical protein